MSSRERFEAFIVDEHHKSCERLGLDFDDAHKQLIDNIANMLVRKWNDGKYKEDDVQDKWESWQESEKQTTEELNGVITDMRFAILRASISSCSCLTKTPEVKYHKENCRYRILMECIPKHCEDIIIEWSDNSVDK